MMTQSQLLMAQTFPPRVAVVNQSTVVTDAVVFNFTKSLQMQARRHFAPVWGIDCTIVATRPADVHPYNWVLAILDNSDQADALGYHDLTPQGKPIMKVFAKDAIAVGVPVSAVASHELLETLVDPFIESNALRDNGDGSGALFALEVCDPVEADLYSVLGNMVSNFVTPWWFGDPPPAGQDFDYLRKLKAPFTTTPGGYFNFRVIEKMQPWTQLASDTRAKALSRLFRRSK